MSLDALMNQPVTVQFQAATETTNSINEPTFAPGDEVATTMYLEPRKGREQEIDRNTPITDWLGLGRVEVPFVSTCRIVYGSHTFDVMGDPRPQWNPRLGAFSHIEMDLQEVT